MSDTTSAVRAGGIEIVEAGNSLFLLMGRTYQHKEIIKSMGGRWLPGPKAWSTSSYGHAKKILNAIIERGGSGGDAGRRIEEEVDPTTLPMEQRAAGRDAERAHARAAEATGANNWLAELPSMAYAPRLGRLSRFG